MSESKRTSARLRTLFIIGCIAAVSICTFLFWRRRPAVEFSYPVPVHVAPRPPTDAKPPVEELDAGATEATEDQPERVPAPSKWVKPKDFKIVGVLFYGRARFVNVLDCYLRMNLVSRGGYLDEIRFMVNTKHHIDVEWLDGLVAEEPLYKKVVGGDGDNAFDNIWSHLTEDNTMYIKIDDDIVYVDDDTIPRMVQTLQAHPEAHNVAANIVNSPITNWLHWHSNAVLPYLPEISPANGQRSNDTLPSWRASHLPQHGAPAWNDFPFPDRPADGFTVGQKGGPPYKGHRWLPLENTPANLALTPITKSQYHAFGKGWTEWTIAAQQHYSLLEHLEKKDLGVYWAGGEEGVWNMQYERYNLNFLAIWGSSVRMQLPDRDDEQALTVTIPMKFKRPTLVDTHAIIGHFAFGATPELEATDLLDRYLSYANEMVCEKDNQRHRLAPQYLDSTNWQKQEQ